MHVLFVVRLVISSRKLNKFIKAIHEFELHNKNMSKSASFDGYPIILIKTETNRIKKRVLKEYGNKDIS